MLEPLVVISYGVIVTGMRAPPLAAKHTNGKRCSTHTCTPREKRSPTTSGKHNLHLTLTALFSVDGESTRKTIRTFDKTIEIEVTPAQLVLKFLENNWQWLWAAILLPIVGWGWKLRKASKKGTPKSSDT